MFAGRNTKLWVIWLLATLCVGSAFAAVMYVGGSRELLLIGKTTSAHHQIELACESCHTAPFFSDRKKVLKAMNKACLSCHKDELKVSNDSHPVKKFRDPRNFDRREKLDALQCSSCHMEHTPEITKPLAVTLPEDYCLACHQDVGDNRPSHQDLGFETCASAGCHNYHDNTALYEDFLVKNAGGEWIKPHAQLPFSARAGDPVRLALASADPKQQLTDWLRSKNDRLEEEKATAKADEMLSMALYAKDAIAPEAYRTESAIEDWAASAHATGGVNCAGCHAPRHADETDLAILQENWVEAPDLKTCNACHKQQAKTFKEGKHGMRAHPKISKPRKAPKNEVLSIANEWFRDEGLEPLSVSEAMVPMKPDAHDRLLGNCGNCHKPHEQDLREAAVEACTSCHNDDHTNAYFTSPHYSLWQAEMSGDAEPGTGVGCSDCHMPKVKKGRSAYTTHNQNAYFRPNEKMIRPVCMQCHSVDFAIDALADPNLVENNFNGRPTKHIESIDWALKRARKTE